MCACGCVRACQCVYIRESLPESASLASSTLSATCRYLAPATNPNSKKMKLHVAALATLAVVCILAAGSEAAPKAMSDTAVVKAQLFPDAFWEGYKNVSAEFKKMVHGLQTSNIGEQAKTLLTDTVAVLTPYLHKIRENVSKMYQAYVEAKHH
ncbi:blood plasma apolipoprotein LAL1 isoform X1 [Lampetra planeri]